MQVLLGPTRVSVPSASPRFGAVCRPTARIPATTTALRRPVSLSASAVEVGETGTTDLAQKTKRKYVMVSGKGGVGKTSLSASLAVKYAEAGHDTLIVSTDPAHSLGDSLGQKLAGGLPVPIEGTDLPIWGMEIDPAQAQEEFKAFARGKGTENVKVRRRVLRCA